MSWAADGQDGNGLHLEKNGANFFKFIASVLEKSLKLRLIYLDVFLFVLCWHVVYDTNTYIVLKLKKKKISNKKLFMEL